MRAGHPVLPAEFIPRIPIPNTDRCSLSVSPDGLLDSPLKRSANAPKLSAVARRRVPSAKQSESVIRDQRQSKFLPAALIKPRPRVAYVPRHIPTFSCGIYPARSSTSSAAARRRASPAKHEENSSPRRAIAPPDKASGEPPGKPGEIPDPPLLLDIQGLKRRKHDRKRIENDRTGTILPNPRK